MRVERADSKSEEVNLRAIHVFGPSSTEPYPVVAGTCSPPGFFFFCGMVGAEAARCPPYNPDPKTNGWVQLQWYNTQPGTDAVTYQFATTQPSPKAFVEVDFGGEKDIQYIVLARSVCQSR